VPTFVFRKEKRLTTSEGEKKRGNHVRTGLKKKKKGEKKHPTFLPFSGERGKKEPCPLTGKSRFTSGQLEKEEKGKCGCLASLGGEKKTPSREGRKVAGF